MFSPEKIRHVLSVIVVVIVQFYKGILKSVTVKWLVKLSGTGDGRGSPRLVIILLEFGRDCTILGCTVSLTMLTAFFLP